MAAFISLKDSNWDDFISYTRSALRPEVRERYSAIPQMGFKISELDPDEKERWIARFGGYWMDVTQSKGSLAVQRAVHETLGNGSKYAHIKGLLQSGASPFDSSAILLQQIEEYFKEGGNSQIMMSGLEKLSQISVTEDPGKLMFNLKAFSEDSLFGLKDVSSLTEKIENSSEEEVKGLVSSLLDGMKTSSKSIKNLMLLLNPPENPFEDTSSTTQETGLQIDPKVTAARKKTKKSYLIQKEKGEIQQQVAKQKEAWKILENDPHALMKFFHFCAESSGGSLESSIPEGMWEKFAQKQSEEMLATQKRQAEEAFLQFDVEEAKPSAAVAKKPAKKKKAPPAHSAALAAKGAVKPKISGSSEPVAAAAVEDSAEEKVVQALRSTLNTANVPGRLQIHPRVKRWRNQPSIEDIRAFIDSDSQGALTQKYAGCKPKDIEYLRKCHNIPVDRMIGVPDLENKYSVGYRFAGSDGGIRQGRCFYAKIDFGNDRKEAGVIRAAVNPQGQVYHIMFERRERMTLEQCTEGVAELSKPGDCLQDDDSFSQVGAYQFNVEDKGVTITIAEAPGQKPTVVKILPLN